MVGASLRTLRPLPLALLVSLTGTASAPDPVAEPAESFASGLAGPEGLAFTRNGGLIVASTTGEVRRYAADGTFTVVANVGESLAGVTDPLTEGLPSAAGKPPPVSEAHR